MKVVIGNEVYNPAPKPVRDFAISATLFVVGGVATSYLFFGVVVYFWWNS